MKQNIVTVPDGLIAPLSINGLNGRVLKVPAKAKKYSNKQILMIYGHHASLERMYGIVENVAIYGNVTMPDLPGFGGMDSFDRLGQKPNLDKQADYLATFIKLYYRGKKVSILGMSLGFVVVAKMLQKYPDLNKKVELLISLVGFTSTDDFSFKKSNIRLLRATTLALSPKPAAWLFRYGALNSLAINIVYRLVANKHSKMKDADKAELKRRISFEVHLWQCNDVRTYMLATAEMMRLDITGKKVSHSLIHVTVGSDQYFNNKVVERNLKKVFREVKIIKAKMGNHAPTVIDDAMGSQEFIPKELRKILAKF